MLDCISKLSTGRFLVTALMLYKRGRGKSNSNSNKTTYNGTAVADVMESINVLLLRITTSIGKIQPKIKLRLTFTDVPCNF
jgi:hypothetical protein